MAESTRFMVKDVISSCGLLGVTEPSAVMDAVTRPRGLMREMVRRFDSETWMMARS